MKITPEDLLQDDDFLNWYYNRDQNSIKIWVKRLSADSELRIVTEKAILILDQLIEEQESEDVREDIINQSWNSLASRIEDSRSYKSSKLWIKYLSIAASCVLILSFGVWKLPFLKASPQQYLTDNFTIQTIELLDGTIVKLNRNSKIKISDFKNEERVVWLTGEANFDVKHTLDNQKFTVYNEDIKVEVIGTQFNVKGNASSVEVVLESGKVQLEASDSLKVMMFPGELVTYNKKSKELDKKVVQTESYTNWKQELVRFDNASLQEVANQLRDKYGFEVEIDKDNKLGNFNGTFSIQDPHVLIKALERTYEGQVFRKDDKIIIRKLN